MLQQKSTVVLNDRTEVDMTPFMVIIRQHNIMGSLHVVTLTRKDFDKLTNNGEKAEKKSHD